MLVDLLNLVLMVKRLVEDYGTKRRYDTSIGIRELSKSEIF